MMYGRIYLVDGILFFFSSRRRHTRCSRDWSSDVCSSDLQRTARPQVEEVVDLRIAELGGTARDYKPGRDPWRFVVPPPPPTPPPPPPPKPPTAAELQAQREAEERLRKQREAQLAAAAAEAAKPKPPPFTLQYLGKFGPEERPIAVFTDGKS